MRRIAMVLPYMAVILLALLFVRPNPSFCGEESATVQPLFPVRLEHTFPRAKETFEEIKNLILNQYYSEDISEEALYWAAIQGMLRHISPPKAPELCQIWTPEAFEKILLSRQGQQVSLGFKSSFNPQDGSLTVSEVMPNSPAEAALKPLDRILRIDNQSLKGKTLEQINTLMDGPEDTQIALTINRDVHIFDVTLQRRKFATESLIVSRLTDTVALVEIKNFTANISHKLKNELNQLKTKGFKKLIVDLRNTPGGIFIEALRIVEMFLPEKHILLRTFQRDTRLQNYISVNAEPFVFEMAVLVNRKTASSAEILTGALQDNQKAFIVGTRTFGKGVFEETFKLDNEFRVKFITGAMYSPKGHSWQDKGITPDFWVEQDEETLAALMKMDVAERFAKDIAMITAYKLLMR